MSLFTDIVKRYEATNTSIGTDKCTTHSYGEVYNIIFDNYKNTTGNILEIGISGGFGLCAYVDYFKDAQIYGIDIEDICTTKIKNHERVHLYFGDATLQENVDKFNIMYDIVIEDGSHLPEHQIKHFVDFSKFVKPGGTYIIEDVHEMYVDTISKILNPIAENTGFSMEVIDLREKKNRFDDIIIVFKRV